MSPVELGHVLGALPGVSDPNVLLGAAAGDDAAVYRIAPDRALVATVDFFTPIVDNPEAYGEIAAANAVSDIYAMGGRPLFALSLVGFPRGELSTGVLERIVAGGARKLLEAGCPVIGGHSIEDPEPKFGYAVIGEVHPDRFLSHHGARPGDLLYLTKPLGSGVVSTAIKRGICPPEVEAACVEVMRTLNRQASEAAVKAGAHACTDVTGYGLLGHLSNFDVGAEVDYGRVPFISGVAELAGAGVFPGGTRRNLESLREVDWSGLAETDRLLLADAQTNGGLLCAVAPEAAAAFETAMVGAPYPPARIGTIVDRPGIRIVGRD